MDSFGEKARWSAFFALDALAGSRVAGRIRKDAAAWHRGTEESGTEERIRKLIRHASATTSFYRHMDPEMPLSGFPVVNKDTYRTHYGDFRSELFSDSRQLRTMTTSGSTGTPFSMIQDRGKVLANTADSIFLNALGGCRIGEKTAFIRVWVSNVRISRIRLAAENLIMMESSSLSDDAIAGMLRVIRKEKVRCITGYASALGEICRYIDRKRIDMEGFEVHAILPISESMPDPVRKRLSEQFGCPVRSFYSNEENGIMGLENPDDDSYYINSESYFIEILKADSDEPEEEGKPGRIVITDLTNYAFPIIRYDNGDMAAGRREVREGRFRLTLTELYGRRSDMLYDTKGNAVTPFVITNHFWNAEGVRQYRFLQTGEKTYDLELNGDPSRIDAAELLERIRPSLGGDADIRVTYVDEIPVLASGKRKYIENLWKRQ